MPVKKPKTMQVFGFIYTPEIKRKVIALMKSEGYEFVKEKIKKDDCYKDAVFFYFKRTKCSKKT